MQLPLFIQFPKRWGSAENFKYLLTDIKFLFNLVYGAYWRAAHIEYHGDWRDFYLRAVFNLTLTIVIMHEFSWNELHYHCIQEDTPVTSEIPSKTQQTCSTCGKTYSNSANLRRHEQLHKRTIESKGSQNMVRYFHLRVAI